MAYRNKSLRIVKRCVHKMSNYIHFCVKIGISVRFLGHFNANILRKNLMQILNKPV